MADAGPLQVGDPPKLGEYELVGRLGEGGQGVVYLGRYPDGREVAVKLLRTQLAKDDDARSRFARELEVIERVAGFCTAQVLDSDVIGDTPYIVSEYVRGPSLQELVEEQGPRTGTDLERLAIGTATALTAIHQAGVVHRDFKPPNVLIGPDGPRVIDFGIARALDTGATMASGVVGTPAYMAPEQVSGERVDTPVDLFAWGATMGYAATGRKPFNGNTVPVVINQVLNHEPDLEGIPSPLRDLLYACMAKDPQQRPSAQEALLALLGANGGGRPSGANAVPILSQGAALATQMSPSGAYGPAPQQQQPYGYQGQQPYGAPPQQQQYGYQGHPAPAQPNGFPPSTPNSNQSNPYGPPASSPSLPPKKSRNKALLPAVGAAAAVVLIAGGIWLLSSSGGSGKPGNTPPSSPGATGSGSDGGIQPVQAPADALEAKGVAQSSLPIVLSYNFQHLQADQDGADSKLTARFKPTFDAAFNNGKANYLKNKVVQQTTVENVGVISEDSSSVKLLAVVREVRSTNGAPQTVLKHIRLAMSKNDSWLIDNLEGLDKSSQPTAATGATWPGPGAKTVLKAAQDCELGTQNYDYTTLDALTAKMNKCATGQYLRDFNAQIGDLKAKAPTHQGKSTETLVETAIEDVPDGTTVNILMTVQDSWSSKDKPPGSEFKTLKITMQIENGTWKEGSTTWNSINSQG